MKKKLFSFNSLSFLVVMAASLGQSKYWCFTLNNVKTFDALNSVKNWDYMIAGKEVGDKGTPHLQCFVVYKVRTKFSTVKIQLPTAHIEKMISTPTLASDYCKKDGDFMEFGELPKHWESGKGGGQAKAANYRSCIDIAIDGDLNDIIDVNPVAFVQHYHSFKRIKQDNPKKPENIDDVCGIWYHGEPGVGKSHKAREENPDFYDKPLNKWWDGYQNEPTVLLDDLSLEHGNWIGYLLKRWTDKFSFPAEHKGTTVQIRPKKFVITSNYTIEQVFHHDETLINALKRRFKCIQVLDWRLGMPIPIALPAIIEYAEHSAHSEEEDHIQILDDDEYEVLKSHRIEIGEDEDSFID